MSLILRARVAAALAANVLVFAVPGVAAACTPTPPQTPTPTPTPPPGATPPPETPQPVATPEPTPTPQPDPATLSLGSGPSSGGGVISFRAPYRLGGDVYVGDAKAEVLSIGGQPYGGTNCSYLGYLWTVEVPSGSVGTVPVRLVTASPAADTLVGRYTYVAATAELIEVTPSLGPSIGGNTVQVQTRSVDGPVYFGDAAAIVVSTLVADDFESGIAYYTKTVLAPAGIPGTTVDVTVGGVGSVSSSTADDYTYLSPDPTPLPTPATPTPVRPVAASVSGAARLATLTRGNVSLRGALNGTYAPQTGDLTASLALADTSATLRALGVLPLKASVGFEESAGSTRGELLGGQLSLASRQTIRIRSASVFGIQLVTEPACRTAAPSQLQLTGAYDPAAGGSVGGTFAISGLADCGYLTVLLSSLTAGGGNQIRLDLPPVG